MTFATREFRFNKRLSFSVKFRHSKITNSMAYDIAAFEVGDNDSVVTLLGVGYDGDLKTSIQHAMHEMADELLRQINELKKEEAA